MLRAHAAPAIIFDGQLLAYARNIFGWASPANHVVLVPARVGQVGDLINATSLVDPARAEPSYREQMVGFACRAPTLRGRV